jgi:hypothetical protein
MQQRRHNSRCSSSSAQRQREKFLEGEKGTMPESLARQRLLPGIIFASMAAVATPAVAQAVDIVLKGRTAPGVPILAKDTVKILG